MIRNFFGIVADIITRNPLTTLFLVMLFVAAPSLFGVLALIFLVPLLFLIIIVASMLWRVRRVQRQMEEQMRQQGFRQEQRTGNYGSRAETRREGDVTLTAPQTEQRVSDDVGEYVPFTEEKNDDKK